MTTRRWLDNEVSLDPLSNIKVAVIGYGIQGAAQASNIKDSGVSVVVGLRPNGQSWNKAIEDNHTVLNIPDAVKDADLIHILIPDMEQENTYKNEIEPHLDSNKTLSFSHGAAIHWKWINPREDMDVIMVAPKGPGQRVRELFLDGFGTPSLVAVYQNHSKKAWDKVLALAKAIGSTRPGVLETTFKEEVETDWFGEQVDLCGGVHQLILKSFETLVESGYRGEIAYFECLHELKLIVDLVQKYGITGMYQRVSETARFGGLTRGKRIINENSKENMKEVLKEIQSGKFANEWVENYKKNKKEAFETMLKDLENHEIEKIGKDMRKMMWPHENVI